MKWLITVVLISACSAPEMNDVESTRQAGTEMIMLDTPERNGAPGAHLGAGLSTCTAGDGTLIFFSAPGHRQLLINTSVVYASAGAADGFDDGGSIACASVNRDGGGVMVDVVIAGNPTREFYGSNFSSLGAATTRVAAFEHLQAFAPGKAFWVRNILTGVSMPVDAGHPINDLVFADVNTMLVAVSDHEFLHRFTFRAGGTWQEEMPFPLGLTASRVVVGNVFPNPGTEVIVAGRNALSIAQVQVFTAGGTLIDTFTAPMLGDFGASLAIEKNARVGLDAWWVGHPSNGSVWRYFGSQAVEYRLSADLASQVGASIAVETSREVWVGAPDYNQGAGAVFHIPAVDAGTGGEVCVSSADCACGAMCLDGVLCGPSQCPSGMVCVGVCEPQFLDGGVFDGGVFDGGVFDGGAFDGGAFDGGVFDGGVLDGGSIDSGVVDAGGVDAGLSDAGSIDGGAQTSDAGVVDDRPRQFASCGCSSGEALIGLLALALVFRRSRPRSELPSR